MEKKFSAKKCVNCYGPHEWIASDVKLLKDWKDKMSICLCAECKANFKFDVYPDNQNLKVISDSVDKAILGLDGWILSVK